MRTLSVIASVLSIFFGGCSEEGPELLVDLETDLVVGVEFAIVQTEFHVGNALGTATQTETKAPDADSARGMRVAVFEGLPLGPGLVRVQLLTASGDVVATQTRALEVQQRSAIVLRIHRSCAGVVCPDAAAPSCIAGDCVAVECDSIGASGSCGRAKCSSADDCDAPAECATVGCRQGACYYNADDSQCTRRDEVCHPVAGCIGGPVDAGLVDAGSVDAGVTDLGTPADVGAADSGIDAPLVCAEGFADCDSIRGNGCEVNLATDPLNCDGCENTCMDPANGTPTCEASACGAVCDAGYATCGAVRRLCSTSLRTATDCGRCGNACPLRPNAVTICTERGSCWFTCATNFSDCDGNPTNGCEVDTRSHRDHCGDCLSQCAPARVCEVGMCVNSPP